MLKRIPDWVVRSRLAGRAAYLPLIVRIGAGGFVALAGVGKFVDRTKEVHDFRGFGVPLPEIAVPLAGTIEVVGGLLVVLGFLTRPAALAVAGNLLGALLTAGVNEGGTFHLVVGPTLMTLMLFLVWSGAGAISFDTFVTDRRSTQSPTKTT